MLMMAMPTLLEMPVPVPTQVSVQLVVVLVVVSTSQTQLASRGRCGVGCLFVGSSCIGVWAWVEVSLRPWKPPVLILEVTPRQWLNERDNSC